MNIAGYIWGGVHGDRRSDWARCAYVPRTLGRDPARDRAAAVARGALRVRAAGCTRLGAVPPVLPFEDSQRRGARERSAGGPLGVLRAEPRRARPDRGVRFRSEAGEAQR